MAISGFYESSLSTSEIWADGINENNKLNTKAINLIKTAKHLTNEDIEAAYISVKQITDSLTRAAMKAFDEERIVLVYNENKRLSITQALPFITYKMKRGYITYVFVDNYVKQTRDGVLRIDAPIFRDLITGALISGGLKTNYSTLASNQYLEKVMMEVYTKLVIRILNREFSIAADKIVLETLEYWINRFFLNNIFGSNDTPENIENLAHKHFKFIDEMKYEEIKTQYNNANPGKISELLNLLKTASPRMRTLNLGTFLNNWINYYYVPSMLAVDNIEYLIFMMITMLSGNNIVSIAASDIVKEAKNIKSFRGELLKLI